MIRGLQQRHEAWSQKNFGHRPRPAWHPLLGIGEEAGELMHHFLKRAQGIRKGEDHDAGIKDALADIFIYMLDFCNRENIDLQKVILDVIRDVHERNWVKHPDNAHKVAMRQDATGTTTVNPDTPDEFKIPGTFGRCKIGNLPVLDATNTFECDPEGEPWPMGKK